MLKKTKKLKQKAKYFESGSNKQRTEGYKTINFEHTNYYCGIFEYICLCIKYLNQKTLLAPLISVRGDYFLEQKCIVYLFISAEVHWFRLADI